MVCTIRLNFSQRSSFSNNVRKIGAEKNQFIKADKKRVPHQSKEIGAGNKIHKMLQSNPITAHDSLGHIHEKGLSRVNSAKKYYTP